MAMKMTIGVDFGGSSSKATLLSEDGRIIASASREYPSYYPQPGWMEQNPDELYGAFVENVRELLQKSGVRGEDISALAIDAATHMAVFTDENDKPLRNIIHWSDRRSSAQAAYLATEYGELLAKYTCNAVGSAWTLPHILWLREHKPEILKKTRRIYFLKDYIRHRVCGDFATDYIEAMGAMLADDRAASWAKPLCDLAGVDISMLPPIKAPTDIAGTVLPQIAAETGLSTDTKVLIGTTDTALEVYASGAVSEGCATVKLATAGRICPITRDFIPSRQFFNYKHVVPGLWYPGTGTRSCAASYKWFRDVFGDFEKAESQNSGIDVYEQLNRLAEKAPAGSEGLFFHPYLLGEMTPYYDDRLRASFTGVAMHHHKGHFTRAVMEGVAYSMLDCLMEIKSRSIPVTQFRLIGGGAKGKLWRQIMADVLGEPMVITRDNDSSLGSAMLAGVAVGIFPSFEESVARCVKIAETVEPNWENHEIYVRNFQIYRDIQKALSPVYHKL